MDVISRTLTDGRTLTGRVEERPRGWRLVLRIDGKIVEVGVPQPLTPPSIKALPRAARKLGLTWVCGSALLTEQEARDAMAQFDSSAPDEEWAPEGRDEIIALDEELTEVERELEGTGPDDGGPETQRLNARLRELRRRRRELRELYPAAALEIAAIGQQASTHWSDPVGKAAGAKRCLKILAESRGEAIEEAREALASRKKVNPWT